MTSEMAFFRSYQRTHPWITFKADLRGAGVPLWLRLGEACSKCQHIAGTPLQPAIAQMLNLMFLAKGAHGTTAIEGNTLSEEEVRAEIEGKLELPPSRDYLKREVDNVVRAFNEIVEEVRDRGPTTTLSLDKLLRWNELVLDGVADSDTVPGRIRKQSVGVAGYRGAPPEDCGFLLERMCQWLSDESFSREELGMGADILRAVLAHLYIAWIHPFDDGNGRTARLTEFYILVNVGVPVAAAHLLSDYYNQTRPKYYHFLKRASDSGGDIVPFVTYAVQGFVEGLAEQIRIIRSQQWYIAWRDFVNEYFEDKSSEMHRRRRLLVLDLSNQDSPVPKKRLPLMTPRLAQLYAAKTQRVLDRDLAAMREAGLIRRTEDGSFRANRELILAFLPPSWSTQEGEGPGPDSRSL